ncbi:CBS domain-containing protein [Rhodohalobacter mucosus]|uniref:CBS domain-containing protein n=1 Tax=Rhodohalobacter mucosus TaxID=2079485 RepID=A0A316TW30_9BACT|nr:CBS domain-containing protein [Rhodohalobacter mucosus]PWN08148.1 CBS domain-containing protein [Rhodohalobacter mucosus]
MLAKELLNTDFTPLDPEKPVSAALAKMDAWQTTAVPVVDPDSGDILGQVNFNDIVDLSDESVPLSTLELSTPIYVFETQHIFEVARKMLQHEVRLLPVVDDEKLYTGIIEKKYVLEAFSELLNITTQGSVITVEMHQSDFTLSELVHLIETEGAKILGLTVGKSRENESMLHVSIKLSLTDTSAVTSSLQRHGYHTITENKYDLIQTDLSSRADELLRYLDV